MSGGALDVHFAQMVREQFGSLKCMVPAEEARQQRLDLLASEPQPDTFSVWRLFLHMSQDQGNCDGLASARHLQTCGDKLLQHAIDEVSTRWRVFAEAKGTFRE